MTEPPLSQLARHHFSKLVIPIDVLVDYPKETVIDKE